VAATGASCAVAVASGWPAQFAEAKAAPAAGSRLVMSGDCGGTNTRLVLVRVPAGVKAKVGEEPDGEVVFAKKYLNAENTSFVAVCEKFLSETSALTGGEKPQACCLACAGGIVNNTVSFTNVTGGWTIDGNELSKILRIPKVKLINDFEAQGYGLLTLGKGEVIQLNDAAVAPGAPIACVGAGTGLGECYLTADGDGKYTCWPSEGGHAEFSPRSEVTFELLEFMKNRLTEFGTPEKIGRVFKRWDVDDNGSISREEFAAAVKDLDLKGLRPRRISVERVVSGPGISAIYDFLRKHWAFEAQVDPKLDAEYMAAPPHMKSAIVARGNAEGQEVCKHAIDTFVECYGSEVGVAALKWLPRGGLYISGGIAAKNPSWIQSETFMSAYKDKGRLSPLVMAVPLFVVLTEDTGERGALFYAVQMLG